MTKNIGISACFPAYNDGGTIASMVVTAMLTLSKLTDDYEVIVCNDGSSDFTPQVLDELVRHYPNLHVIHHPQNRGYGSALRSAFARASKELVFYTDGDAQYDVRELELLVPHMQPGIDIVNGYKISRNDPLHRIFLGNIYRHLMRLMFGYPIRDVDCDFRLIRRHCFEKVQFESTDGTLPLELVKKFADAGFAFFEVPVHHFHRVYGTSQIFNLRRLGRVLLDVTRLWIKLVWRKESAVPMQTPGAAPLPK